ncbi:Pumilio-family RNA binding repeat containing protein [Tritrichomonas foetus]|uniref:Pumilio-family RNA binding repeat containing protein n=1 Tax=Tritrichomonas foetus TaxID=1144522 RepID=A0A1J4JDY1_9EUKA|nr:Pumilio-family RNA binding repeat containing protein [Tritrichomonas foetus]|eukprot:OHS97312.1 Pumilio-family RNA binding repeat containing protein [Tritrichomonas foetus]
MSVSSIIEAPLYSDRYSSFRVHLITSDLWEAMTGERVSPASLCQLSDCSMFVNDFQNNQNNSQIQQIVNMAKDRQKSRQLQHKMSDCSIHEKKIIFDAINENMKELVFDSTANFVVQKFCEISSESQQTYFLNFFLQDIKPVVDHPSACRVLQKFIETTNMKNIDRIYTEMKSDFVNYCLSANGNHIVQRFVSSLPHRVDEIVDMIKDDVIRLAVDNCGCRVVQGLFDQYDIERLDPLVGEIINKAVELATNQYGNYVVQYILSEKSHKNVSKMIKLFKGHFYDFSIHKFASNVMEKCIRGTTKDEREMMFDEILCSDDGYDYSRIMKMVVDQFGNYVIQRIVEHGNSKQQNAVYDVVYENYDFLMQKQYAKHVISRLEYLGFEF